MPSSPLQTGESSGGSVVRENADIREQIPAYKIKFEGPILPRSWPYHYHNVFQPILTIHSKQWETYGEAETERRCLPPPDEIKQRASELVELAYNCRQEFSNEEKWRFEVEPEVFKRFSSKIRCDRCHARIWDPAIKTLSSDPPLLGRRRRRKYCQCRVEAQRSDGSRRQGHTRKPPAALKDLFSYNVGQDAGVKYEPADGIKIQSKEPDRVYGLRRAADITTLLKSRRPRRDSPLRKSKNPLAYPFLVVEAKRERTSHGFSEIEVQTAFPIRELLKVQAELFNASSANCVDCDHPLVWFLASRGDEWRLYGCVVDGPYYRIFDLWHGYILSLNGALQLLLIIEYICDWANDIYRPSILKKLESHSNGVLRGISPIGSDDWSMIESLSSRASTFVGENLGAFAGHIEPSNALVHIRRHSQTTPLDSDAIDESAELRTCQSEEESSQREPSVLVVGSATSDGGETVDQNTDVPMFDADRCPWPSTHIPVDESHPLLKYRKDVSSTFGESNQWTKFATVRYASIVKFSFRHLHIPNYDQEGFLTNLKQWDEEAIFTHALRSLFNENPIILAAETLDYLAEMWTGTRDQKLAQMDGEVLTSLCYHTYVADDWSIVRELVCVSCYPVALDAIRPRVLNINDGPTPLDRCWRPDPAAIQSTFTQIRDWDDTRSIEAAFVGLYWDFSYFGVIQLEENRQVEANWKSRAASGDTDPFELEMDCNNDDDGWYFRHGFSASRGQSQRLECFYTIESLEQHHIQQKQEPPFFNAPYFPIQLGDRGYVLLKRAEPWREPCQAYCLLFYDSSRCVDDRNRLLECLSEPSIWVGINSITPCPFGTDSTYGRSEISNADQWALEEWQGALRGEECGEDSVKAIWETTGGNEDNQEAPLWELNFY